MAANVRGRGAAAAAHDIQPAMIDEFFKLRRQRFWRLAKFSLRVREPGVRVTGNAEAGNFMQAADVIRHQIRAGGAIHPDR